MQWLFCRDIQNSVRRTYCISSLKSCCLYFAQVEETGTVLCGWSGNKLHKWLREDIIPLRYVRGVTASVSESARFRWAGSWGIDADFIAKTKCSIICIKADDMQVFFRSCQAKFTQLVLSLPKRPDFSTPFWKLSWDYRTTPEKLILRTLYKEYSHIEGCFAFTQRAFISPKKTVLDMCIVSTKVNICYTCTTPASLASIWFQPDSTASGKRHLPMEYKPGVAQPACSSYYRNHAYPVLLLSRCST